MTNLLVVAQILDTNCKSGISLHSRSNVNTKSAGVLRPKSWLAG